MSTIATPTVPRRTDARRNLDLLVRAADVEFRQHGADVSLEDIARRAGVGIGTLYRHFPTRDDLIARVLADSTAQLIARGGELLRGSRPSDKLLRWIRELVVHVTTYRGLTAALANSFVGKTDTQLCQNCTSLHAAGAALLARAQKAGEIRKDADVREIILSAHAAAWIAEQTEDPSAVDRLLGILFDGLRVTRPTRRRATTRGSRRVHRRRV